MNVSQGPTSTQNTFESVGPQNKQMVMVQGSLILVSFPLKSFSVWSIQ